MGKTVYVVIDDERNIYGVYEEYVDAQERQEELETAAFPFYVEEYTLNKDFSA